MLFSEAVIAVQLRNSMFPLALRWSALRPPQQLLRDTNGKIVFFLDVLVVIVVGWVPHR